MGSSRQLLHRGCIAFAALMLLATCGMPPQDSWNAPDASPSTDTSTPVQLAGFSWVYDDRFAAMPRPGGRNELSDDLAFLERQGIQFLVSLTVTPTDADLAAAHGILVEHIPVPDFTAPTQAQIRQFVVLVDTFLGAGVRVGVHCGAGLGRSGTMAAAYFVFLGLSPSGAITLIRQLRPGSIETAAQEQAIRDYADCGCLIPDPACQCDL